MGIRRSWAEVDRIDAAGQNDIVNEVYKAMRTVGCELWEAAPDWVTENKALTNSFIRAYMNDVCKNEPITIPPAPSPPFTGGQCVGTTYSVFADIAYPGTPSELLALGQVGGAISAVRAMIDPAMTGTCGFQFEADGINEVFGGPKTIATAGSRPCPVTLNGWVINVFSGPDNCGDPPIQYPSSGFDPMTFSDTIEVPSGDGVNLTFPVVLAPVNVNFPLTFDLGGLTVKFDLGGINIDYTPIEINNEFQLLDDGQPSPLPAPSDDVNRNTCTKLTPSPDDTPPDGTFNPYNEVIKSPTDPKEETVSSKVRYIRITITGVPANSSSTSGQGAPDVIFPGWFMWKQDDFLFPRQFIGFEQTTFIAPEGANGYAYTLKVGYTGFATIYELDV